VLTDRAVEKPRDFDPRAAGFPRSPSRRAALCQLRDFCRFPICWSTVKPRNQQNGA
jgi:hypothetical protein